MKSLLQWILLFTGLGMTLGGVVASLVAPGFITWYSTPGGSTPALCDCADLVSQTISRLQSFQLYGLAIGAVVGNVVGFLAKRTIGNRKKGGAEAAPAAG